ncbi:MAG: PqqD family protein [Gemmatimonadetes bacterium]|nr:PqqD family protein [Gemmatimonadota bacterium]
MKTTHQVMPAARSEDLLVEELPDETLVYDLARDRAHCLNRTAALVWRHCDGRTGVSEVAALLEKETRLPADDTVVWMALSRLARARLLEEPPALPAPRTRYARREVIRALGLAGGLSLLLPAVESIVAPLAAAAASCITLAACQSLNPPCGGMPICENETLCCKTVKGACGPKAC